MGSTFQGHIPEMHPKQRSVAVLNGDIRIGFTSLTNAERLVTQKRAFWRRSKTAIEPFKIYSDGQGMATLEAIRGLPVVGDLMRLMIRRVPSRVSA